MKTRKLRKTPIRHKEEAYVINLKSSEDRWIQIQKDFEGTNIHLNRVEPVNAKRFYKSCLSSRQNRAKSLYLTFLKLIKMAKKKNMPNILILEDDCCPAPNFSENWPKIKDWLHTHLDEWDLYTGGSVVIKDPVIIEQSDTISFIKPKFGQSTHFVYVNSKSYNRIIEEYLHSFTYNLAIDTVNYRLKCIISYPFLAYQSSGKSTLTKKYADTYKMLENKERELGRNINTLKHLCNPKSYTRKIRR